MPQLVFIIIVSAASIAGFGLAQVSYICDKENLNSISIGEILLLPRE
jgi:hypothetical protein